MAGNLFDNPTMSMMYRDALQSLYNGAVMPWDREILAVAPLPADVVDPFASQEMDPRQVMGFAYNSLMTWVGEAKKANYFSKHFTDLSKLVLKGVMTMGRGLMTLHYRGESLDEAPMQIGDLISVASYHFRKSYLGVIQTAKSHPEISERLLLNQLSWTNMLMRLYKTREKLTENKKSEIRNKKSDSGTRIKDQGSRKNEEGRIQNEGLRSNSECGMRNSELPSDSGCEISNAILDDCPTLDAVSALFEPAALSAPRALSPIRNAEYGARSNAECGIRNAEEEGSEARIEDQETKLNAECGIRNSELQSDADCKTLPNEEVLTADHYPPTTEDDSSLNENLPPCLQILRNAFERSEPNEEGRLTFTFDEVRYLASDPVFARIYPDAAADMRCMVQRIDSG